MVPLPLSSHHAHQQIASSNRCSVALQCVFFSDLSCRKLLLLEDQKASSKLFNPQLQNGDCCRAQLGPQHQIRDCSREQAHPQRLKSYTHIMDCFHLVRYIHASLQHKDTVRACDAAAAFVTFLHCQFTALTQELLCNQACTLKPQ